MTKTLQNVSGLNMCALKVKEKTCLYRKQKNEKKRANLSSSLPRSGVLKKILEKSWGIAIEKEAMICFCTEVKITKTNYRKMFFSETYLFPTTHREKFCVDIRYIFCVFDCIHNDKMFPKYFWFE